MPRGDATRRTCPVCWAKWGRFSGARIVLLKNLENTVRACPVCDYVLALRRPPCGAAAAELHSEEEG